MRDRCLCLHLQRAARAVARRFDQAFRPFDLTNGQFSMLMALNRPVPSRMTELARFLAMDRTTLTAALKPLQRRGLVTVTPDPDDGRGRLLTITDAGQELLVRAVPVWRETHDLMDQLLSAPPDALRADLKALGMGEAERAETESEPS